MSDPRLNLPSASAYSILEACPGSEALVRSIPVKEDEDEVVDEQAERGTRIHKAWETGDTSDLSEDELEDYNSSISSLDALVTFWRSNLPNPGAPMREIREQRLWLHDSDTMEPLLSGQFDRCYICGQNALVADLKSGWCKTLTRADQNRQLRVLNVLVWKEYGVTTIQSSFIKPKIYRERVDSVLYTESDLIHSEAQIFHSLWKKKQPDAQRVPGSHCTYCRAKGICPESGSYSMLPSVVINAIEKPDIEAMVDRMDICDLRMIQSRASVIQKILEAVKLRLKKFPSEELARVGLQIGKGRRLDPVVKTKEAFDALIAFGIKEDEVWSALSFSKGELVKAVMRDQGWAKKPTEGWLWDQTLKPFIEKKQSDGSIEEI